MTVFHQAQTIPSQLRDCCVWIDLGSLAYVVDEAEVNKFAFLMLFVCVVVLIILSFRCGLLLLISWRVLFYLCLVYIYMLFVRL